MRSQRDIWILNYFDNVIPDVTPISDDKVNLDFVVEEKNQHRESMQILDLQENMVLQVELE